MEMSYDRLDTSEIQGATQADYLISVDACLRVVIDEEIVFNATGFPVVELARCLRIWLKDPFRGDFEFDSMSLEEVGVVAFRREPMGWTFSSTFVPDAQFVFESWDQLEQCCRRLVSQVETDLEALGLEPSYILR